MKSDDNKWVQLAKLQLSNKQNRQTASSIRHPPGNPVKNECNIKQEKKRIATLYMS